jgi:hypothetical protein
MNPYNGNNRSDEEEKGLLWKLPEVRFKELGRVGPAFGFGAGCGVGFGVGLVGGNPSLLLLLVLPGFISLLILF